jgi:hypothetical protein
MKNLDGNWSASSPTGVTIAANGGKIVFNRATYQYDNQNKVFRTKCRRNDGVWIYSGDQGVNYVCDAISGNQGIPSQIHSADASFDSTTFMLNSSVSCPVNSCKLKVGFTE